MIRKIISESRWYRCYESHVWVCLMIQPRRPSCGNGRSGAKRVEEWWTWLHRAFLSLSLSWTNMAWNEKIFSTFWTSPPSGHKLNCVRQFISHLFDYFYFAVCLNFKLSHDPAQHQPLWTEYSNQTCLKQKKNLLEGKIIADNKIWLIYDYFLFSIYDLQHHRLFCAIASLH